MQRTLFNSLSVQLRRSVNVTTPSSRFSSPTSSARLFATSPRVGYPGPNPAPTASEDAVAADRGETVEEDVTTTVKQTVHKVVQKGSDSGVDDPHHPGKSDIDHLESPSISEEAVHAEKHASDPLPDHRKASSSSSSSSSSQGQVDAQHPGRSAAPDHLENPSLSEAFVHADKGPDPLAGKTKNASSHPIDAASGVASNLASAAGKVAGAVKEAVGLGNANKRSFSTSVARPKEDNDEGATQHLEKSGHSHLDKPSVAEEETHADKSDKDPLPKEQNASTRKGDKAGIADSKSQQSKH
ncbi:hypothetical protein JCM3766R1_002193 [Sporobolomyces carnicolor]